MVASPRVMILMGSPSDLEAMSEAAKVLEHFGVPFELEVTSAHRSPGRTLRLVADAEGRGVDVFIVGAGMAAHLAGVVAAHTTKPVLGVPMDGKMMGGLDALLSTAQMPRGVPVGTLAVGRSGASNAGLMACQILALADPDLRAVLEKHKASMAADVERASAEAQTRLESLLKT